MVNRKRTVLDVDDIQQMEAIALGVRARLDLALGYSKLVTEETIEVARRLGIPEKKIQSWAAARATHYAERTAAIKTSLDKLQQGAAYPEAIGETAQHHGIP